MSSSTSSSEAPPMAPVAGSRPTAFFIALAVVLVVELAAGLLASRYMGSESLIIEAKLRQATSGPSVDILALGDSTLVAAFEPARLDASLPSDTRVYNYGIPAAGPTGAEMVLRRYLANHPPPRLVLLGFSPASFEERSGNFVKILRHLGFWDVVRTSVRTRSLTDLWPWIGSRPLTVRNRKALRTAALSAVVTGHPSLEQRLREALGFSEHRTDRYRFRWERLDRSGRNRRILIELEQQRGWHIWREGALRTGVLPDAARLNMEPFEASPREIGALRGLLEQCRKLRVPVLSLPMPEPARHAQMLERTGGRERYDAIWAEMAREFPNLSYSVPAIAPMAHAHFSDTRHVNARGSLRWMERTGPLIARSFRALH